MIFIFDLVLLDTGEATLGLTDIQQLILEVTEGFLDVIRQVMAQVCPGSGQQRLHGLAHGQPVHRVLWAGGGGVLACLCDGASQVPWNAPWTDHGLGSQHGPTMQTCCSLGACVGWLTFVDLVVTEQ